MSFSLYRLRMGRLHRRDAEAVRQRIRRWPKTQGGLCRVRTQGRGGKTFPSLHGRRLPGTDVWP